MYSENNGFNEILNRLLANVDNGFDKREGSIIYDALAPAAAELAQCYIALDVYANQTNLLTTTGENLDAKVVEYGLERIPATYTQANIEVKDVNDALMSISLGSRFAVPNEFGGYNYTLISTSGTGLYIGECETAGSDSVHYIGELLPLQGINNLGEVRITSISKPGEDEESDDTLRARTLRRINQEAFAGNKAAYREMAIGIDGVEDCKVYPVWNGGGTVKLAIIGANHTLPSSSFINDVQTMIDPIQNQGEGVGLAPIGHSVTVISPTPLEVNISATLELMQGSIISQVQPSIEQQIGAYLYAVQNDFVEKDVLLIYLAKVSAAILNVPEVVNVSSLTINGVASDLEIDNSVPEVGTHTVQYPVLGTVTLL